MGVGIGLGVLWEWVGPVGCTEGWWGFEGKHSGARVGCLGVQRDSWGSGWVCGEGQKGQWDQWGARGAVGWVPGEERALDIGPWRGV